MNTFSLKIYLPKVHHNHRFRNTTKIDLTPGYLQKSGPKLHTNGTVVNTSRRWLTIQEVREQENRQRLARAMEYQSLLDKHSWTRAELARQLGVSRAWVSTVLRNLDD